NGVLTGSVDFKLSSAEFPYEQKFVKQSADTLIFRFRFQDVFLEEANMAVRKDQVFIEMQEMKSLAQSRFQKVLDFGLKRSEWWTVEFLFNYKSAKIIFEKKNLDNIIQDTIYQFKVVGQGPFSHTDQITRIYGSRKLGLVRVDSFLQQEPMSGPNKF